MSSSAFALSCYTNMLKITPEQVKEVGNTILIPTFSQPLASAIVSETKTVLQKESPVAHLDGEFVIVGDLHGNFYDMLRIFAQNGFPPNSRYIFLGDYVDRGEMSLEVILFLFILKTNFPDSIFLLHGNHEFPETNRVYGFYKSCKHIYDTDEVYNAFNDAFQYLPIAAIINKNFFCVHGGISKRISSLSDLESIKFPIQSTPIVVDLTWSDPMNDHSLFCENQRGKGCLFGQVATSKFLTATGMKMVIRSHECVNGCRYSFETLLLTVFSSSHYAANNRAGYARVVDESVDCFILPEFKKPDYNDVCFYLAQAEKDIKVQQCISNVLPKLPSLNRTKRNFCANSLLVHNYRRASIPRKILDKK